MEGVKLSDRFEQALVYASRLHRSQVRKGTTIPYVSHLLSVTALVLENGGSEDEAIAALLHDAIEDQGGDGVRQEIWRKFGRSVGEIVEGCTESDTMPKPPWRERKERQLKTLERASDSVRLVSLADKLHNARSTLVEYRQNGDRVWEKFKGGREGTLWFYRQFLGIQGGRGGSAMLEELDQVVAELEKGGGRG